MKGSKYFIKSSLLAFGLMLGGLVFFLTSASSIKKSNNESITKISKDLVEITAEYEALMAKKSENSVSSEPYIGEIAVFGMGFAPRGWAQCNGQLLPISGNEALFNLLGTIYGGDGRSTFGLPDMRGRVAVNNGQSPGLQNYPIGRKFGRERISVHVSKANVPLGEEGDESVVVSNILPEINIMQPSITVNYCIALTGIFPSRS